MEEKHLKIFAVIFIFLFIIFFITKPRHAGVNIDDFVQNIIIGISKNDIKTIEVYKEASAEQPIQMIFTKSGEDDDRWTIPTNLNCNVQKSAIDRLLNDLLEMTGKVRSSDPKHFDTYYISDEQGIHLLLKDAADKTLANMIIGKKAEDFNAGFIRFTGKEKVYSVDKNILSSLNIQGDIDTLSNFKLSSFIDLQAINQDKDKLETVMLVAGNRQVTIKKVEKEIEFVAEDSSKATRIENQWVLVRGNKEIDIRQKKIDDFFRDVAKIRANEVIDRIGNTFQDMNKSSRYGFQRPSHYIVFKSPDSAQQNVIIGKEYEKDEGYYLFVQYDGLVYKLNKSTYDRVFKWVDELPEKVKG
jgi:hypothetical protein